MLNKLKIAFIGPSRIGKSTFIHHFISHQYDHLSDSIFDSSQKSDPNSDLPYLPENQSRIDENYYPTIFDTFTCDLHVEISDQNISENIELKIVDTSGDTKYDICRPITYDNSDVIVLCFSLVDKLSLYELEHKFYTEVKNNLNSVGSELSRSSSPAANVFHPKCQKIVLLGLKSNLVNELPAIKISEASIETFRRKLDCVYLNCSDQIKDMTKILQNIVKIGLELYEINSRKRVVNCFPNFF